MDKHDEKPQYSDLTPEDRLRVDRITQSDYFAYIEPLRKAIKDKVVAHSITGSSGFVLLFQDGSWALSYLKSDRLKWKVGSNELAGLEIALINSAECGDGSQPLIDDLPYADEECDISAEVAHSHGQPVTGVAIGEDSFNFCFPEGKELEAMIVRDENGKIALRVYWEQW